MLRANSMELKLPTDDAYERLRVNKEDTEKIIDETIKASNTRN